MTRTLRGKITVALVALALVVSGFLLGSDYTGTAESERDRIAAIAQDGEAAHDVLCAQRAALLSKVQRTENLLIEHPGDLFGIPRGLIKAGLNEDKATLATTLALKCQS